MTAGLTRPIVPRAIFLLGIFVAFAALFVVTSRIVAGDGATPPPPGDTQDYDNIAVQLLRGRGFAIDYDDREWRRPYQEHNPEGDFDEVLARKTPFHLTTYHPPLLPIALAVTYRIFGRDFLTWRIIESLLTALGLALICDVAWRAFGPRVALIAAGVMFLSATYVHYIAHWGLMSEPLAIFLVAVLVWAFSHAGGSHPSRMALLCGAALALLCLTRSLYVLWVPVLAALLWWMSARPARTVVIFLAAVIAIQTPWWIRNCRITGQFMPFGTQAGLAMLAAYGDLAVAHHGYWWWARPKQHERAFEREVGPCIDCSDVQLSRHGLRGARVWALRHPTLLPLLAYWKVSNTWMRMSEAGPIAPLFWVVLVAPLTLWRQRHVVHAPLVLALVLLIFSNLVGIALTWTVGWRFLVPVEPLLSVLVAVPVASVIFGESAVAMPPARGWADPA